MFRCGNQGKPGTGASFSYLVYFVLISTNCRLCLDFENLPSSRPSEPAWSVPGTAEATPLARAHVPCCPLAPARRASADPDAPCLFYQHLLTLTARRADAAHASEMKQESNPSFKITGGKSPNLGEIEEKHTLFVSGKLSWGAGQTET